MLKLDELSNMCHNDVGYDYLMCHFHVELVQISIYLFDRHKLQPDEISNETAHNVERTFSQMLKAILLCITSLLAKYMSSEI